MKRTFLLLISLFLASCHPPPPPVPPTVPPFDGCSSVLTGSVCVLCPQDELRLWIEEDNADIGEFEAWVDAKKWNPSAQGEWGWVFNIGHGELTPEASRVAVRAGGVQTSWELNLVVVPEAIAKAGPAACISGREGDLAAARVLDIEEFDGETHEETMERLEEAINLERQHGFDSFLIKHLTEVSSRGDFAAARKALDELPPAPTGHSRSLYLESYSRGIWALEFLGDLRAARRHLDVAVKEARRRVHVSDRRSAEQMLAGTLNEIGLYDKAKEILEQLKSESLQNGTPRCDQAELFSNIAWEGLVELERRRFRETSLEKDLVDRVITDGETAHDLFAGCPQEKDKRLNNAINLALAYLHAQDPREAREWLKKAQSLTAKPSLLEQSWWYETRARIALAAGDPAEALEHYDTLAEIAVVQGAEWRAALGRAQALYDLGRLDEAFDAFDEAEAKSEEALFFLPMSERARFAATRDNATRLHLDLLIASDLTEKALHLARRSRSRVYRGLQLSAHRLSTKALKGLTRYRQRYAEIVEEQANDWQISSNQKAKRNAKRRADREELRQLLDEVLSELPVAATRNFTPPESRPRDLLLVYHPLPQGWVGLAQDEDGIDVHTITDLKDLSSATDKELSTALLEPFAAKIHVARRVKILPYGRLITVDMHVLPFAGQALIETVPVVYGVDLPPVEVSAPTTGPRRAILVNDPTRTLLGTAREIKAVRKRLSDLEWETEPPQDNLDADTLLELFEGARLLHFAGHSDSLGWGEWESDRHLKLAKGSNLSFASLLVSRSPPRTVILASCASAQVPFLGEAPALSLAEAFLLAGSEEVLGAVRDVDDQATTELVLALYAEWDGSSSLARALREVAKQGGVRELASFRVIER